MAIKASDIKHLLSEYHILFIGLIAILLPFQTFGPRSGFNPIPLLIVIWGLVWLSDVFVRWRWSQLKLTWNAALPMAYVLISILSILVSKDMTEAWGKIQVRLALFFMPIFFINRVVNRIELRAVLRLFILSNIVASLILIVRALVRLGQVGWHALFYVEFSHFMHPSYFAMLQLLGMLFLLFTNPVLNFKTWIRILIGLLFFLTIYLCSSRAGLLVAVIVLVIGLLKIEYPITHALRISLIAIVIIAGSMAAYFNYRMIPATFSQNHGNHQEGRTNSVLEPSSNQKKSLRIVVWGAALELIKEKWLIGYGIGDVQDELTASYYKHDYKEPAAKRLNAHNQYIESLLEFGILSLLSLLALLFPHHRLGSWRKNVLAVCVLTAFAINFLFESMLNTQAGVVSLAWILVILPALELYRNPVPINTSVQVN